MIEVSLTTAFMLYLFLTLVMLFGLWTYHHYSWRLKKVVLTDQELFVCEYCLFAYLSDGTKPVTQCPQCKSFNKENRFQKRT